MKNKTILREQPMPVNQKSVNDVLELLIDTHYSNKRVLFLSISELIGAVLEEQRKEIVKKLEPYGYDDFDYEGDLANTCCCCEGTIDVERFVSWLDSLE
jgi:hypothetical protein